MKVLITRGAGDSLAPETIIDPLAISPSVGADRGKQFLYDEGFDKKNYEIDVPYRDAIYPTDLIAVLDGSIGESFVTRVTGHLITVELDGDKGAASIVSSLSVERSDA